MFTTHFYTKLSTEGVKSVLDWTTKRDIDIFFKKAVFVPIHKDHYWSLAVVINAGFVDCFDEEDEPSEIPCILHLDALSLHDRKSIAANIRIWLNAEWNNKKYINVNMFTALTIESFSVPGKSRFSKAYDHYYSVISPSNNKIFPFFSQSLNR